MASNIELTPEELKLVRKLIVVELNSIPQWDRRQQRHVIEPDDQHKADLLERLRLKFDVAINLSK